MNKATVLIIDDDQAMSAALTEYLQAEGYGIVQAPTLKAAYQALENNAPDLAITDYELPDGDALQFLATLRNMNSSTKCIVLTGHGTIDLAVRATKEGAEQFVTKPVQFSVLSSYVKACLEHQQNQRKQLARKMSRPRYEKNPFQGTSESIQRLAQEARKIVNTERPILIQGETGTGKGVLAEWIHKNGPRAEEALVDVNCAGLSKDLLESELFGYEKGAFTSANSSKQGLVEVAHRGILFLDELGEMDLMVQPKLLKILEDSRFRRLGDVRERVADIQVIAATNRNLMQSVRELRFREDLYFRISTFHLRIPPLRERAEDIPVIAATLLRALAKDLARPQQELSPDAETALKGYSWPGNIRELRNVLERVALTCDTRVIEVNDLNLAQRTGAPRQESAAAYEGLTLAELERQHIARVLEEEDGKVAQAAIKLGIPRSTLYQKIKVYGLQTTATVSQ
ncbi:MAG TPA: sigma-54 dependent transcriptional regulator [Alphaproteobacteria bacterium]|nr:sigma-54 dependent transcriptional regulator [Alphaproteobacteria bacterium]